jgi:hypothetical protein
LEEVGGLLLHLRFDIDERVTTLDVCGTPKKHVAAAGIAAVRACVRNATADSSETMGLMPRPKHPYAAERTPRARS